MVVLVKIVAKLALILSLAGYLGVMFWPNRLPPQSVLLPGFAVSDPIQTPIKKEPYIKKIGDQTYRITPLFNYDIQGLVVADYDSQHWLDITHQDDPAQTKDLCLVWGDNLVSEGYRKLKYSHGEFTCYYRWKSGQNLKFNPSQFSNNHLFPVSQELRDQIAKSQIGDQVHIKGQLVNYERLDSSGQVISTRTTSTVREDMGNGACEVILADFFDIVQANPIPFAQLQQILPLVILGSLVLNLILFILLPVKLPSKI